MKIAVFGCSWTAGSHPKYISWVEELAKLKPEHTFVNYAIGGLSNSMIMALAKKFKKEYDISIVKLTSPGRLSFFNPKFNIDEQIKITTESNYHTWIDTSTILNNFVRLNYAYSNRSVSEPYSLKTIIKFHKMYYSYVNEEIFNVESEAAAHWCLNNVDLTYSHLAKHYQHLNIPVECAEKQIPYFKQYIYDHGYHVNQPGAIKEAEYIANRLNL